MRTYQYNVVKHTPQYIPLFFLLFLTAIAIKAQEKTNSSAEPTSDRWGFINIYDSTKNIPAIYRAAGGFSDELAAVKRGLKWGYINVDNQSVLDFQFDYVKSFDHGHAIVRLGDLYGVITKKGEFVIPASYYDLIAYKVGKHRYYISRDSTFFQGIIDSTGIEVLPHQYTYIITYQSNISNRKLYDNIPFYTVHQHIDTSKGSFLEQFQQNTLQFSPEKGRLDLYDLKFDKLASRKSATYTDGFQHQELVKINHFLDTNKDLPLAEKAKEVDSILGVPERAELVPIESESKTLKSRGMNRDDIAVHLTEQDYHLFTNKSGEYGLKKGEQTIIPAKNKFFRFFNLVVAAPIAPSDIPYLQANYAGSYRAEEQTKFDLFYILAGDEEAEVQLYNLNGTSILTLKEDSTVLSGMTTLGFKFRRTSEASRPKYGLLSWKGAEILPPVFKEITVLKSGYIIAKQENRTSNENREQTCLYDKKGKLIIPSGMYAEIKEFGKVGNLFLATRSSTNSTVVDKKAARQRNVEYAILKIKGNSYSVTNTFSANLISVWSLDQQTGMLPYRQSVDNNTSKSR